MYKRIRMLAFALAIVGILGAMISPTMATEPAPSSTSVQQGDSGLRAFNGQTGALNFINFAGQNSARATNGNEAMAVANSYAGQFGLAAGSQLGLVETRQSRSGASYYHFQQTYNGIPVLAGDLIVAAGVRGNVTALSGEFAQDLSNVNTRPGINGATAAQHALNYASRATGYSASAFTVSTPELYIYDSSLISPWVEPALLVYRLDVRAQGLPYDYFVLVNARSGGVRLAFNQIDTLISETEAQERVARFVDENSTAEVATVDPGPNGLNLLSPNYSGTALTYDSDNSSDRQGNGNSSLICSDTQPATVTLTGGNSCDGGGTVSQANAAHFFALDAFDMFDLLFGRNSINNAGMPLISNVNYTPGGNFANAFWDGQQMTYGNAGFFTADDVVGHELSHGITQFTSGLFYYYESGAINEALSDIFGEFMDQLNGVAVNEATSTVTTDAPADRWLLGEDLSIGEIRNMANPPAFNDPDRMRSPDYFAPGGVTYGVNDGGDNGGVHINSGVANKAAYLMVDGASFNGRSVTALAPSTNDSIVLAANIWYEVEYLLSSGSDYGVLYQALSTACYSLLGQTLPGTSEVLTAADCTEVNDAALATEMNLEPAFNGYSPEAPVSCNTFGTVPEPLYFNDLESGVGDFDFSSDAPVNEALIWDSGYAWSGTRMIWADDLIGDDYGLTGIDTIATLTNDVNLTGGSEYYLHFWHAWGLEEYLPGSSTIYDGAVVEYSTNGGSSWTDIGPLFEDGKDYDGTITTAFDNPLKGRQAFAYDSHGYVSSRYDLSSLAGQNVRFRWRLGTDDVNGDVGWVIDDILVYTCSASAPLTASVTCNNPNLEVTITGGDGPFNITVSEGQNMPVIGVNTGTTVVLGPDRWRNITVTETTGDSESIVLESKLVCRSTENTILLAPPHRSRTTDTTPFFDWTDTTDANLYRIFIFDNKVQADRTVDIRQNNSLSQWTATPALPTQRLFWRARARVNHAWGYWSVRWTLFIDPVAPVMLDGPPQDGAMPSTPVLSTPVVVTPGSDGVEVPPAPTDVPTEAPTDLPPPPNSR